MFVFVFVFMFDCFTTFYDYSAMIHMTFGLMLSRRRIIDWRTRYLEHLLHCFGGVWSAKHNSLCKRLLTLLFLFFLHTLTIYVFDMRPCVLICIIYISPLRRLWIFIVLNYFIILIFF